MGTDIHGAVEVNWHTEQDRDPFWVYAANISHLVGRNYEVFASLFGVRGFAEFEALAPDRGLPDDVSRMAKSESWGHSHSWIGYDELKKADWEESAKDNRFIIVDKDGKQLSKFGWSSGLDDMPREDIEAANDGELVEWGDGKYLTTQYITRREALSGSWEWLIFDLLPVFADRYGEKNVRMVVWFDS